MQSDTAAIPILCFSHEKVFTLLPPFKWWYVFKLIPEEEEEEAETNQPWRLLHIVA